MQGLTEVNGTNLPQTTSVLSETQASRFLNACLEQPADFVVCIVISHKNSVQLVLLNCMFGHVGWIEQFCIAFTNTLQFARFKVLAVLCLRIPFFWNRMTHRWVISILEENNALNFKGLEIPEP